MAGPAAGGFRRRRPRRAASTTSSLSCRVAALEPDLEGGHGHALVGAADQLTQLRLEGLAVVPRRQGDELEGAVEVQVPGDGRGQAVRGLGALPAQGLDEVLEAALAPGAEALQGLLVGLVLVGLGAQVEVGGHADGQVHADQQEGQGAGVDEGLAEVREDPAQADQQQPQPGRAIGQVEGDDQPTEEVEPGLPGPAEDPGALGVVHGSPQDTEPACPGRAGGRDRPGWTW